MVIIHASHQVKALEHTFGSSLNMGSDTLSGGRADESMIDSFSVLGVKANISNGCESTKAFGETDCTFALCVST